MEGVKYTIREVQEGDAEDIANIVSECFFLTTPRQMAKQLRRRKQGSKGEAKNFVGVVDGKTVSQVAVVFRELHLGEGVYIKTGGIADVCTDSDYRRKGMVTKIMKYILEYAKQKGASNASLYTGFCIPAHRIYSRFGFISIERWPIYVKFIDFPFVFLTWIKAWNRRLKHSKLASRALRNWDKTVVLEIEEYGAFAFKCKNKIFRRLKKLPTKPDLILHTDIKTLLEVMADLPWEHAMSSEKLKIKQGRSSDVSILRRILPWAWE